MVTRAEEPEDDGPGRSAMPVAAPRVVVDHAAVFAALPTPYLVLTPELVIADANAAYLATTGRRRDELIGRDVFDAFPGNPDATEADGGVGKVRASLERARDAGRAHSMAVHEFDIPDSAGGFTKRFWSLISAPVLDEQGCCRYVLQRAEDITDYIRDRAQAAHPSGTGRKWRRRVLEVESDLFARAAELRAAREAEAETARRLAALSGVALALGNVETLDDLAHVVTEKGLVALGAHGGAIAVCEGEADLRLVLTEGMSPGGVGPDTVLPLSAPYPGCRAARTGERVLLPDRASSEAFSAELAELGATTGVHAWAAVPLESGDRRIGSLSVGWTSPPELAEADVELLVALAAQCAQALERIRARDAERERHAAVQGMAEVLQRSLLTEPPQPGHLEIAVRYRPAASQAQVGGDWYDSFLLRDGRTALVIGDVTGHDRHAAAAMAQVRNVLRGVAHCRQGSPADVLRALDLALQDLAVDTLATAVLATVEQQPEDAGRGVRLLRWSNAGHPPPLLLSPEGAVTVLEHEPDLLLGLDPATPRADHVQELVPGSTVVLYTDGLVERRDAGLDQGIAALVRTVGAVARQPLETFCDSLLDQLAGAVEDDVALLVVRARPQDRPPAAGAVRVPEGRSALSGSCS